MTPDLAAQLEGKSLGDWTVVSKIQKPDGSGGGFSSGYIVEHKDGTRAYLKAFNVAYAFRSTGATGDPMGTLKELVDNWVHERDLLTYCGDNRLDRIVVVLGSGTHQEPGELIPVPYLIFELCENGDIRYNPRLQTDGLTWRLRVFHGVCVGVWQLHSHGIIHQDLKPANILVFGADHAKIADLGRATTNSPGAKFNKPGDIGDIRYVPFELCYRHIEPDWETRRKAADLYALGVILGIFVASIHITGDTLSRLPPSFHPANWKGTYKDVLPEITHAFSQALDGILAQVPNDTVDDFKELFWWLCHPDPTKRGHPENHIQAADRFSLERVMSKVDKLVWKTRKGIV